MKLGTIIVIGVAVVGLGAGLWWAFAPRPVGVDLAAVEVGDLVVNVSEEGVARIRDVFEISAPVSGQLLRLPVKAGDSVVAGQAVATILPQESALLDARSLAEARAVVSAAEDAVLSAESDLKIAESERNFAKADVERKERLLERGVATLLQVEQVRLELARREALLASAAVAVEMRRHQLEQAQARLAGDGLSGDSARRDVLAPQTGQVLRIVNESSRMIAAGTPIMEMGDPAEIEIVVDLLSADAVRIAVGAPAVISNWGGDRDLVAEVVSIEPIAFTKVSALGVEEQRVSVHLDLRDPVDGTRRPGHLYRVLAAIEAQRVAGATLVPTSALFRNGGDWSVFRVEDGKALLTPIGIAARNSNWAAVSEGLAAGASVIVHPSDLIADGTLVAPR
jgi:HlyD family secretion protein